MKVARALGAAVCALALIMTGCSNSSTSGSGQRVTYANGGTFTEQIGADPGNLDPHLMQQPVTYELVSFAYDTLINIDHQSGKVVSQLAQTWQVTPNSVTFDLRRDVTCADGGRLTPSVVAANFDYIKDPKHASTVIGGQLPDTNFTVRADDGAGTVTITTAKPYGFLLEGAGLVPIVCPKGLANRSQLAHHTFGTGPFNLVESVADDHYTFQARKDYRWGPGGAGTNVPGFPDKVVFRIVTNETTAANLLLSGQLNAAGASGPDYKRLQGHGFQELSIASGPYSVWYNQRPGHPGADPAVRKALTMALDLDQLTKVVTQDNGSRATSLEVNEPKPCRANIVAGTLPNHDTAGAAAMLDQSGWTAGTGGVRTKGGQQLSVTLLYPSVGADATGAGMELISQWWKQLGVDVKLKPQNNNALVQTLFGTGSWDAAWLVIGISYPTEFSQYVTGPAPPQGQNFAGVANADYRRFSAEAIKTPSQAGCGLWAQAEQTLLRNLDVVPVANINGLLFASKARYTIGVFGSEPTSLRLLAT